MRLLLLFVFSFISFVAFSQAPPMTIGGPQGISVKRILAQDWMSVPIMADTPVAPLTGSGWPGRGYIVFVAQNPDSICGGCPPADTSLWEYTGQRWKRVGMDYLTKLVFGGEVTQSNTFSRRFFVGSYGAFINGSYYTKVPFTTLTTSPKTADSTSRIDAIVLTPLGPTIKVGIPKQVPLKPSIASDEIELSTIYFPPFDTVARFIPVATGVTSIFRVAGRDSIYYTIDTVTFAIKDSIGISKNDTATMLNNYKFTAANGLTKDSTVFRLGGSLNQNTNINLNNRRLSFVSAAGDTSLRITTQGRLLLNTTDTTSNHIFYSNGRSRILSLEVTQGENAGRTGQGIRIDGTDRTFGFQGSANPTDMFKYSTWVNDTSTVSLGSSPTVARNIISIYTGFSKLISCGASSDTTRANVLNIAPRYVFNCDSSRNLVRGIYYNPSIVNINRTNHVAYENTTGTNLLNSVSGSTRIGYNTFDTTYRLDVNGRARVSDTLTLSTTPVTADTSANDLLVINSSNGQVRRFTGDWPNNGLSGSATLDFGNTSAQNSSDLTITVTGAADGDAVSLGVPNGSVNANTCFTAWVSATDTVTVRFNNYSSGAVDPASGTFKIKVLK